MSDSATTSTLLAKLVLYGKYGNQYSYAIKAAVTGNVKKAKSEVMKLLNGWKVPK
jgi:hypothetical protein